MKRILLASFLLFATLFYSFSYTGNDVNLKLGNFASELNLTLPNAATQQNVYSSAWIGKLFPSAPPHFAVGFEAGVTKLNLKPLKEMAEIFGVSGLPSLMIYPTITVNGRIGGFVLPFDIGFSAMYMDLSNLNSLADGFGIQFFNIGGDLRYALLKGEGPLPQFSLGFGYYYINGNVSFSKDELTAKMDYSCHTMFLQAQISKTLLFFTPFAGVRGIFSSSDTNWLWTASASRIASASDYTDLTTSGNGKSSTNFFGQIIPQIYGGFGMNFGFFALTISGAIDLRNIIWAGDLSLRFQM
ncbi:MAG: hypothetical protein K6A42_08610 [Treponema sp.]|nr:hypothetical protein [Treponema sp.]